MSHDDADVESKMHQRVQVSQRRLAVRIRPRVKDLQLEFPSSANSISWVSPRAFLLHRLLPPMPTWTLDSCTLYASESIGKAVVYAGLIASLFPSIGKLSRVVARIPS